MKERAPSREDRKYRRIVARCKTTRGTVAVQGRWYDDNLSASYLRIIADRETAERIAPTLDVDEQESLKQVISSLHYGIEEGKILTLYGAEALLFKHIFAEWGKTSATVELVGQQMRVHGSPRSSLGGPFVLVAWVESNGTYHFQVVRSVSEARELGASIPWITNEDVQTLLRGAQDLALPNRVHTKKTVVDGRIAESLTKSLVYYFSPNARP